MRLWLMSDNCITESIILCHARLDEEIPADHVPFYKNKKSCNQKCKKCGEDRTKTGYTKSRTLPNTESVTKHLLRNHQNDKNLHPTFEQYFEILEKIAIKLEKGDSPELIPEVVEWKILVK